MTEEIFTFEETIKFRPRCLYQNTCLHLKQKTRACQECIHYKEYWREVVEKEQIEKIKRLEQENKELKEKFNSLKEIPIYKQCKALQQENKELQAYKDVNEDFKQAWYELNEKYKQLRSALEEIRTYLDTLSSIDSDFTNTETYLRIQDKINKTHF